MKKKQVNKRSPLLYISIFCLGVAILFMAMPTSGALGFGNPYNEDIVITPLSYFHPSLFGYADIAPGIAATMTTACAIFLVFYCVFYRKSLFLFSAFASGIATIASFFPTYQYSILYERIHWISVVISIALFVATIFLFVYFKESEKDIK